MPASETPLIRPATDADGPAISALVAAVFAEYDGVLFVPEEFPELAAPASHYAGKGGGIWVAEAQGAVVGSFAVARTHDGVAEFFKVYLAPAFRGRGLARTLLDLALDHARAMGATAVTLWSDAKFADGHRFYQRNGFLRMPGLRALHDASDTLEFNFRLDPIPAGAS